MEQNQHVEIMFFLSYTEFRLKIPWDIVPCRFDSGPRHQLNQYVIKIIFWAIYSAYESIFKFYPTFVPPFLNRPSFCLFQNR